MEILTSAILTGYRRLKDRSINITFNLGEKSPSECAGIDAVYMTESMGYLCYKANDKLTQKEIEGIEELDTDLYDNPKTQSQRLRNVLYLNWKQYDKGFEEFKDYYQHLTEQIIQHYKDKLL